MKADDWFAESIEIAYKAGIVKGKTVNQFNPGAKITREEMITILMRANEYVNGKPSVPTKIMFKDEAKISTFALESVRLAAALQFIDGNLDGSFNPKGYVHVPNLQK